MIRKTTPELPHPATLLEALTETVAVNHCLQCHLLMTISLIDRNTEFLPMPDQLILRNARAYLVELERLHPTPS